MIIYNLTPTPASVIRKMNSGILPAFSIAAGN